MGISHYADIDMNENKTEKECCTKKWSGKIDIIRDIAISVFILKLDQ